MIDRAALTSDTKKASSKADTSMPTIKRSVRYLPLPRRLSDATTDSTEVAALDAWLAIQQIYNSLPDINPEIKSRSFHLAPESYGGH